MPNIIRAIDHLKTRVKELLDYDVTILEIRIEEDRESGAARSVVQCRMDEWYRAWASEYYHFRVKYTNLYDKEYVLFIDGVVFALYIPEDM